MEPDEKLLNQTIAMNIRLRLQWSQLQEQNLADICDGITEQQAKTLLAGGGAPLPVLYKLAHALNCAVDDLFIGISDERNSKRSGGTVNGDRLKIINSLQSHDLIRQLADVSDQDLRDSIYNLVMGMAGIYRFLDMKGLQMRQAVGE
jgi:hypothetical protein